MKKFIIFFLTVFICNMTNYTFAEQKNNNEKALGQHFYLLEDNNKFGVKDKHDNVIIPAQFDDIKYFGNNEFIVTINSKKGVCNTKGICPYSIIFKNIIPVNSNYLIFQVSDDNYYLINRQQDTAPAIRRAEFISDSWKYYVHSFYIPAKNNGKFGIIKYNASENKSEEAIPYIYDEILSAYNKDDANLYYVAKKNNKLGIININKAEEQTEFIYDEITQLGFNSAYLKLNRNGKYGLFDLKTGMHTAAKFEDIRIGKLKTGNFGENIEVMYDGKWHYIKKGKVAGRIAANAGTNVAMGVVAIVGAPIVIPYILLWEFYCNHI